MSRVQASEFTNHRVPVYGSSISPVEFKMSYFFGIAQIGSFVYFLGCFYFSQPSLRKHLLSATTARLQSVLPILVIYPQPHENEYVNMKSQIR